MDTRRLGNKRPGSMPVQRYTVKAFPSYEGKCQEKGHVY